MTEKEEVKPKPKPDHQDMDTYTAERIVRNRMAELYSRELRFGESEEINKLLWINAMMLCYLDGLRMGIHYEWIQRLPSAPEQFYS